MFVVIMVGHFSKLQLPMDDKEGESCSVLWCWKCYSRTDLVLHPARS